MARICGYCKYFREAGLRGATFEEEKSKIIQSRKCVLLKQLVRENDEACDKFELYEYFYCTRDDAWLDVKVCMARLGRGACVRCKQGRFLKNIIGENKKCLN